MWCISDILKIQYDWTIGILTSVDGCRMVSARPTLVADHRLSPDATQRLSSSAINTYQWIRYYIRLELNLERYVQCLILLTSFNPLEMDGCRSPYDFWLYIFLLINNWKQLIDIVCVGVFMCVCLGVYVYKCDCVCVWLYILQKRWFQIFRKTQCIFWLQHIIHTWIYHRG